jgi:hypothetical protein
LPGAWYQDGDILPTIRSSSMRSTRRRPSWSCAWRLASA